MMERPYFWDLARASIVLRCVGHEGPVRALAFSSDDRTLVSGGDDTTALVWDIGNATDRTIALSPKELESLWIALGSDNAAEAFRAIFTLAAGAKEAVPFLQQRTRPVAPVDRDRMNQLIADLDSNRFAVRQKASEALEAYGELARPTLERNLQTSPSGEARRRMEHLLEKSEPHASAERLRGLRTIEILEYANTAEAAHLLQTLAQGAQPAALTREAKASLERLAKRCRRLQRCGVGHELFERSTRLPVAVCDQ